MNRVLSTTKFLAFALALLSLVALSSNSAKADELYGKIRGVVTDSSGAALPGVQLKLTNPGTGAVQAQTSGSDGGYLFVNLIPGTYSLSASKSNFKLFEATGISVIQNQVFVQNVAMQLGTVSETVEVVANPAQVETTSIQLGATLSGDDIRDLPNLNRNWINLQQTLPGVVTPDTRFGTNFSTNGSQAQQNSYLVNGSDSNDLPLNSPLTQPNPDAIDEVQMVTNTINPEFGRNSGAILNVTTKHGENHFHGSAFEYYRDTFLNTGNFFQFNKTTGHKDVSPFHQHQAGGTIGGPIWKNKVFFFYGLQVTRARQPFTGTGPQIGNQQVFTSAQLSGDWSASALSSNPIPSTLSITGPGGPCAAGTAWSTCFAGNQVPTSNYSSLSTQLLQFVPAPNAGGSSFTWNPETLLKENQHIGRIDVNLSSKDAIWFYALGNDRSTVNDEPFTGASLPGFGDSSIPYTKQFTAAWNHTFSPTLLNEFRPAYTRLNFPTGQPQHVRQPSAVGFPNIFPQSPAGADYPQMAITGYFVLGGTNNGPQPRKDQTYQLTDNLTWTKGKHSLKFGYAGRKFQVWNPFLADNDGVFSFDAGGGFSTGDPGLDFLLGVPATYAQESGSTIIADAYEHYFYAQDQWRVKSNFTLTLGTGYQIDTPISEYQQGGISRVCFQPTVQSTVFPTAPLGYTLPGDPGCNKQGGPTTKYGHFGPRVGFAWSPDMGRVTGGAGKTSIRGGFGLYFNRSEEELNLQDLGIPPFGLNSNGATHPSFPDPFADINAGATVPQPFPYVPPGPGTTNINFAQFEPLGFALSTNARNLTTPYAMNWNFNIQRELPARMILQVGYVGSHGKNLITSYTANPATPAGVQACLTDPTPSPVSGLPCTGDLGFQPIDFPSHYKYPGDIWANFGQQTNGGRSNYNSLQVTLDKHMSHGLSFNSAYTWSHSLDVSSSFEDTAFQVAGGVDSYGNFARDYGSSAFDARHRWVVSFVYDVPNIARNWGGIASRALGGWKFTGDNAFQSGFPINFYDSNLQSVNCTWFLSFYGCSDRPDIVSAPKALDPRSASFGSGCPSAPTCRHNYWFDPSSFTDNALGTEGNTPRGYFRGPGFWNADASLAKETKLTESTAFKMRIDFFNIFNHTNFANPSANFASSRFGRITSIRRFTNSRLIQLGADFVF